MALLTKDAVDLQLESSEQILSDLSSRYNIQTMKSKLQAQIEHLRQQESLFLSALGASSLEEVNQRIKEYKQALPQITNLNGHGLYLSFLNSIEASMEYLENEEQKRFIDYFSQIPDASRWLDTNDFVSWFHSILNSVSAGHVSATHGYTGATSYEQVIVKKLTEAQRRRLNEYIKQDKGRSLINSTISIINEGNSVVTTQNISDWATLTQNQKKSTIDKMLDKNQLSSHQLDNMLRQLYELIISKGPTNNKLFRQSVGEVIFEKNSKTKVFYAGNMLNGITGLLGEIQALFFIKSILGETGAQGADISWIGGIDNPHEDLALQYAGNKVGIQVKNAYKDVEKIGQMADISFMNKAALNFEEVKSELGADYEDILAIYEMDAFNIEYQTKTENGKTLYYAAKNDDFAPSRENIESLCAQADRIMALFAGALMYMQVGEEFSNIEVGNSVFFLGGAVMKFASEILVSIFNKLEQMEENLGFKITSYFNKGQSKVGTIVDYFNSNQGNHGRSVSQALGQLFLQSSYTFTL